MAGPRAVFAGSALLSLCVLVTVLSLGFLDPFVASGSRTLRSVELAPVHGLGGTTQANWFSMGGYGPSHLERTVNGTVAALANVGLVLPLSGVVGMLVGLGVGWFDSSSCGGGGVGNAVGIAVRFMLSSLLRIPNLILAVFVAQIVGQSRFTIPLAVGLVLVASFAATVQTSVSATMKQEFISSARFAGASDAYLLPTMFRSATCQMLSHGRVAVLRGLGAEAALSFFAFGPVGPEASLGAIVSQGVPRLLEDPAPVLAAGLAMIVVLGSALVLAWPTCWASDVETQREPRWLPPRFWTRWAAGL